MSIDPKVELWTKLILTILNLVANGTISLTGIVPAQTAIAIGGGCQVAITLIGAIMTAFSSSKTGPLAPSDPKVVVAATNLANAKTVEEVASAKAEMGREISKA